MCAYALLQSWALEVIGAWPLDCRGIPQGFLPFLCFFVISPLVVARWPLVLSGEFPLAVGVL